MLGILSLDTAFPRIRGDVGAPDTFPFPVRHATVIGAYVDDVVHLGHDALLPKFVHAANELVEGAASVSQPRAAFSSAGSDNWRSRSRSRC
jgi:hypothetical protein